MKIWNLNETPQNNEAKKLFAKNGYDKGTHKKFKVGQTIQFNTGHNDDIRAQASIKAIDGDDLYVYNDCYWFPIQDDKARKITILEKGQ